MTETWKDVVGYEGIYEVSDHGRVRTIKIRLVGQIALIHGGIGNNAI